MGRGRVRWDRVDEMEGWAKVKYQIKYLEMLGW